MKGNLSMLEKIRIKSSSGAYPIYLGRGLLDDLNNFINGQRKILIVTDSGIPEEYLKKVLQSVKDPEVVILERGENSKSFEEYKKIISRMMGREFSRQDAVLALGGGMVGDIAGFAASTYMRGLDFYNFPTSLLAQVDSSVGGKTAINIDGIKNQIGTFYPPKAVVIDTDTLKTLDKDLKAEGLVEAIKMGACLDKEFFEFLEKEDALSQIQETIGRAISIKAGVVEKDEKESGFRRVLNFGHTIGHALELQGDLYHGQAVGLGMICESSGQANARIRKILEKYGLPTEFRIDRDKFKDSLKHDKKLGKDDITTVMTGEIGTYLFKDMTGQELLELVHKIGG